MLGEAAGPGTSRGAGEEGQEEGHGNLKELPAPGGVGLIARRPQSALLLRRRGGEIRSVSPPTGGGKKRKTTPTGEAGGSKKRKTLLPDYASDAEDGEEEWPSRAKPLAKS